MLYSLRRAGCALLVATGLLAACASIETSNDPADPYEGFNRRMHNVNLALDRNVLRPMARGYDTVTPGLVQLMVGNFLSHLQLPVDFANNVLQGEAEESLETFGRFALNSLLGAGGLLDPATDFGVPRRPNDFGVTLGKAGVGEGPFLMLPFFGPTNPRDFAGGIVDRAFSPSTYVGIFSGVDAFGPGVTVTSIVDNRSRNSSFIDETLYNSPDSYTTVKSIYLQRRRAAISGDSSDDDLPIIFEDETEAPAAAQ